MGLLSSVTSDVEPRRLHQFFWDVILAFSSKYVSLLSSGVAFYGMLSIFPGLTALISVYGLVSDPVAVENQINALRSVLPDEAAKLIATQLHSLTSNASTRLGTGLVISMALLLWSARAAASSVMIALNVIYMEDERRGFIAQQLVALALTTCSILFGIVALAAVAIIPAVLQILPVPTHVRDLLSEVRWPMLTVFVASGFAVMYRYAPCRSNWHWQGIAAGACVATLLWIVASALFSFYVSQFSSYDKTYGSLGAVIVLLMWFYVSAIAFLIGALVDAEIGCEEELRGGRSLRRPRRPHPSRVKASAGVK
jgi:membrane protein